MTGKGTPREKLEAPIRVALSMEREELREVRRRAKALGITASAWMRAAIREQLERK